MCNKHHHHVYWRLDFDVRSAADNLVREFNDPPIVGASKWHDIKFEVMRLRDGAHKRRWRVQHVPSGAAYDIVPGANDHTAAGDPYAVGDVWVLHWNVGEIDDYAGMVLASAIDECSLEGGRGRHIELAVCTNAHRSVGELLAFGLEPQ